MNWDFRSIVKMAYELLTPESARKVALARAKKNKTLAERCRAEGNIPSAKHYEDEVRVWEYIANGNRSGGRE